MELLDLKIGGVMVGTLLGVWGAWYILSGVFHGVGRAAPPIKNWMK